jgi:hypothetical protein
MKRPKQDSVSRVSTFAEICERRYFWDCFKPYVSTIDQARGTHVHDALEAVCKRRLAGATWEEALDYVIHHPPEGPLPDMRLRVYLEQVEPILHTLTPRAVEDWFRGVPHPNWCGKIDLVTDTMPIVDRGGAVAGSEPVTGAVDWKTLKPGKRPMDDYTARDKLQLRVYCLAYGLRTAAYVWLPWSGPALVTRIDFTEAELAQTQRWIDETSAVIEERWQRTEDGEDTRQWALAQVGTPLCSAKWCDHWTKCVLGQSKKGT